MDEPSRRSFRLLARAFWVLLMLAAGLAVRARAAQAGEDDPYHLFERVRMAGDGADPQLFFRIAASRDPEAFLRLKQSLYHLSDPGRLTRAYTATSLFKGRPEEEEVLEFLTRKAFSGATAAEQLAAVNALTCFPVQGEERLIRVARAHSSPQCRALALGPVLPVLAANGDPKSCRVVLEAATLEPELRAGVEAAMRSFKGHRNELEIARALRAPGLSKKWKLFLVNLLAGREGNAAEATLRGRLHDEERDVRLRALALLGERDGKDAVEELRKMVRDGDRGLLQDAVVALVSLREADPLMVHELYDLLRSEDVEVRIALAEALADVPRRDSLVLLHKLLEAPEWPVQSAALESIGALHSRESIPLLIEALKNAQGIVREDVAYHLRMLTGVDNGTSSERWKAWFDGEGATFMMPTAQEALALEKQRRAQRNQAQGGGRTASFYGVEITSRKVCFILDTSGSMAASASGGFTTTQPGRTSRLEVAQRQLHQALERMLDGVEFNLIAFAGQPEAFRDRLTRLDRKSRVKARDFIDGWQASGGTALHDALVLAFKDTKIDTIYVLTDGEPSVGLTDIARIRSEIADLNERRSVRIHGIAVGQPSALLRWLAGDTGGQYREVL